MIFPVLFISGFILIFRKAKNFNALIFFIDPVNNDITFKY